MGKTNGNWQMVRFVATFCICLLVGFGLLLAPFSQGAVMRGTTWLVTLCAGLVRLFGGHAAASSDLLVNPKTGYSIQVMDTCNASNVILLLWAAILSFSAPWKQKAKGIVVGTALIFAVNLVRLISLFYLGQYNMAWFEFIHLYVWESLMVLVTLVIFSLWVSQLRRTERAAKQV